MPFQQRLFLSQDGVAVIDGFFDVVPAKKRLVIEFVSVSVQVPPGQKAFATLGLHGVSGFSHHLTLIPQGTRGGRDQYVTSQPIRFYANAGDQPFVEVAKSDASGELLMAATVSGDFIDVP